MLGDQEYWLLSSPSSQQALLQPGHTKPVAPGGGDWDGGSSMIVILRNGQKNGAKLMRVNDENYSQMVCFHLSLETKVMLLIKITGLREYKSNCD